MPRVRPTALLPLLALGFLALALQTLLLRQFLWRVNATGIGVGIFLASWLAWVGIGALLAQTRIGGRVVDALALRFPPALLLYVPLGFAQWFLTDHLRQLVGVPEYLTSPIGHMVLGALIVNAPVSFATGLLFPAGARWFAARGGDTTLAYALDAAGAVVAGVLVTAALAAGVRLEGSHVRDWQRFFPDSRPEGSFTTPAATYLYGAHRGTFYTLSAGGVVDMQPEPDRAAEIAALLLSQAPDEPRVLLLGRAPLSVALSLLEFEPRAQVTWCHDDPAYARRTLGLATAQMRTRPAITVPEQGPQAYPTLRDHMPPDLVVIWPGSLATPGGGAMLESGFLKRAEGERVSAPLLALPLGGGPGAWSAEQRDLVSTMLANAQQAWPFNRYQQVLAPGAGCWLLVRAYNFGGPLLKPADAARRFGRLGISRFPAAAVAEIYDPMRAEQLWALCFSPLHRVNGRRSVPVQRHGLAAALHAEWPAFPLARRVAWLEAHAGMAIPLLLLGALWLLPSACGPRVSAPARLDTAWLAAGGFLGLAGLLALMHMLEAQCGSLYLLAGLASSLFLVGMVVGNRWMRRMRREPEAADARQLRPAAAATVMHVVLATAAHGMILLLLLPLANALATPCFIVAACFVAGVPAGWYVPQAVARLTERGATARTAGAVVIGADAFGSSAGGMVMSLLLLPWLGPWQACLAVTVFAVAVAVCATIRAPFARPAASLAILLCLSAAVVLCLIPTGAIAAPEAAPSLPKTPAARKPMATATNLPASTNAPGPAAEDPPAGKPRSVDMPRLKEKQAKGELSKHPAEFWEPEVAQPGK